MPKRPKTARVYRHTSTEYWPSCTVPSVLTFPIDRIWKKSVRMLAVFYDWNWNGMIFFRFCRSFPTAFLTPNNMMRNCTTQLGPSNRTSLDQFHNRIEMMYTPANSCISCGISLHFHRLAHQLHLHQTISPWHFDSIRYLLSHKCLCLRILEKYRIFTNSFKL